MAVAISQRALMNKAWRDFRKFIDENAAPNRLWRGVADASGHKLRPSVGRLSPYTIEVEKQLVNEFRRRVRRFAAVQTFTLWDTVALAQHHGLPTRLLDWTYNPLVAAYFAVTAQPVGRGGKVVTILEPPLLDDVAYGDPYSVPDVHLVYPGAVSERIVAQRGVFTVHPNPGQAWRVPRNLDKTEFLILSEYKSFFRKKLAELGIDESFILADIDGLCQSIRRGNEL